MKKETEHVQKQLRIECAKNECELTLFVNERKSGKMFGMAWFALQLSYGAILVVLMLQSVIREWTSK